MTPNDKLKSVSDEFISSTEEIWETCVSGLKNLDRIVVDVNSALADMTRGYLVPMLYAYWERFFRLSFSEYIRCLEKAKIDLDDIKPDLISMTFRKELLRKAKNHKIKRLETLADAFALQELRLQVGRFCGALHHHLSFSQGIDWVETESNVGFKVLEKTCKRWLVDLEEIKDELAGKGITLRSKLIELINTRNSIAHGEEFRSINSDDWSDLRMFVQDLMSALQFTLYRQLEDRHSVLK